MNEAQQNVQETKPRKPILIVEGDVSGRVCRELFRQFADAVVVVADGRAAAQLAGTHELRDLRQVGGRDALPVTMADVVDLAPLQDKTPPRGWYQRFTGRYGGRPPRF